jgi:hypothetical protein
MKINTIIKNTRELTDSVILFHSATGKDSILLCDILSKNFCNVICCFMYYVKDLEYEHRYIEWAKKTYSNISFIEVPHFAVFSFIKHGYLGIKKENVKNVRLKDINDMVIKNTGLEYTVFGFKKQDSIDRRIMLNEIPSGISTTKKVYPLMDQTNNDVLWHIKSRSLITPFSYNNAKPSSGCDISDPTFLRYIKNKYPSDLIKIYETYPYCESILFRYENKTK